jgi:hypothetical protein
MVKEYVRAKSFSFLLIAIFLNTGCSLREALTTELLMEHLGFSLSSRTIIHSPKYIYFFNNGLQVRFSTNETLLQRAKEAGFIESVEGQEEVYLFFEEKLRAPKHAIEFDIQLRRSSFNRIELLYRERLSESWAYIEFYF